VRGYAPNDISNQFHSALTALRCLASGKTRIYSGSSDELIITTAVTVCFYALSDAKPLRTFAGNAIKFNVFPKPVARVRINL
jgi:hypothetical protein